VEFGIKRDRDWRRAALSGRACDPTADPLVRHFHFPVRYGAPSGRRLVFFSDLHWERCDVARGEALVAAVNAQAPDWAVFGGDLVGALDSFPAAAAVLSRIEARLGKVAVLGNRERMHFWLSTDDWRRLYERTGFRLLVNETWLGEDRNAPVFAGLDDWRHGDPDLACVADPAQTGRLVITVSHSPDALGHTSGKAIGHLVLAGHTHGGQIRLPGVGALYTSSTYWPQFDRGWRRRESDGAWMYITAGVGMSGRGAFRRRVLCPAEIVVLDFVQKPAAER